MGYKKNKITIFAFLFLISVSQGCSSNPSGRYSLGAPGSKAWSSSTSYQDKVAYFSSLSTIKLCHIWKVAERMENKELVGEALVKRGKDDFFCAKFQN